MPVGRAKARVWSKQRSAVQLRAAASVLPTQWERARAGSPAMAPGAASPAGIAASTLASPNLISRGLALWDSGGGLVAMFLLALLVGVLAGLGVQHLARLPGRPMSLYHGTVTQKQAVEEGYEQDADYLADRARERAVITRLLAASVGSQQLWENPETGNRGVIWVANETATADGSRCRELIRHTLINNAFRDTETTACSAGPRGTISPDVTWRPEGTPPPRH